MDEVENALLLLGFQNACLALMADPHDEAVAAAYVKIRDEVLDRMR